MKIHKPSERRALRAKAHHLHPVVTIGQHGLTPAVLHEIDVALLAHELVKIRVFSDQRDERAALLERICEAMGAAPVQHLGKVLTVWREAPSDVPATAPVAPARRARDKPAARPDPRSAAGAAARPAAKKAAPRRRRPSDVIDTGATGKRRKVTGGKAPADRKRAPPSAKGPFEPGKRTPRSAAGKGPFTAERSRRPATGGAPATRRRRGQA